MSLVPVPDLRYASDDEPGIRRRRAGKSFRYFEVSGAPLHDAAVLDRVRALAVPPAWTDVWICPSSDGHIQATGGGTCAAASSTGATTVSEMLRNTPAVCRASYIHPLVVDRFLDGSLPELWPATAARAPRGLDADERRLLMPLRPSRPARAEAPTSRAKAS